MTKMKMKTMTSKMLPHLPNTCFARNVLAGVLCAKSEDVWIASVPSVVIAANVCVANAVTGMNCAGAMAIVLVAAPM
jgi:hypothetical protein